MDTNPFTFRINRFRDIHEIAHIFGATVAPELAAEYAKTFNLSQTDSATATLHNRLAAAKMRFCVKKHAATRLHYDFRLEWNGMLLSWVIPLGPSYLIDQAREAIQVANHNVDNIAFEGVIAEGRYGAGVVMLWDTGTWELVESSDIQADLRKGRLRFRLTGDKLLGVWALLRSSIRQTRDGKPIWILVKEDDSYARSMQDPDILEEKPNGVHSGRTLEEIKRDWQKGRGKRDPRSVRLFEWEPDLTQTAKVLKVG